MKYSIFAAIAFTSFVAAQSDLPVCAQPCIAAAVAKVTTCGATDTACQCITANKAAIQTEATTCVLTACGDKALDVLTAAEAACAALSASSSGGAASTTEAATSAAAATTTSAAATSAAASSAAASTTLASSASAAASPKPSSAAASSSAATATTSRAVVSSGVAASNKVLGSIGGAVALGFAFVAGL